MNNDHTKKFNKIVHTTPISVQERDAIKERGLNTQNDHAQMVISEWHEEVVNRLEAHGQGRSVTYSLEEAKAILSKY